MKRNWFILIAFSIVLIAASGCTTQDNDRLVTWNTYQGEVNGHNVTIDESRRTTYPDGTVQRIVHIEDPNISYVGVTGHDYNGDGAWDRIFWCGYPEPVNGCNSVLFTADGPRAFEPCPADEGRVKPFTDQEVYEAAEKLYRAMNQVYNPEHLVQTLEDFRMKSKTS